MDASDTSHLVEETDQYPFKRRQVTVISVIQMVIGVLCIGGNIFVIAVQGDTYEEDKGSSTVSYGIWCGVFYVVTASFGLAASARNGTKLISTFCVLSTITVMVFVSPILTFGGVNLQHDLNMNKFHYNNNGTQEWNKFWIPRVATDGGLLFFAVLELGFALWSAIICWIYIKRNYLKEEETNTEGDHPSPGRSLGSSEWFILTLPSGEHRLVNSRELGISQGEPMPVNMTVVNPAAPSGAPNINTDPGNDTAVATVSWS